MIAATITDLTPLDQLQVDGKPSKRDERRADATRLILDLAHRMEADTEAYPGLVLRLGKGARLDSPALVDLYKGRLYMGRYVGRIVDEDVGIDLTIEPRLARPALAELLGTVFNVRLTRAAVRPQSGSAPLVLLLMAMIWRAAVLRALQHGPPVRRRGRAHVGLEVRGTLDIERTIRLRSVGKPVIASRERVRELDPLPLQILDAAGRALASALGNEAAPLLGEAAARVAEWMSVLRTSRQPTRDELLRGRLKLSPMHDATLRPAIEHSRRILESRGLAQDRDDSKRSMSALIDMAEIWELYVLKRMQGMYRGFDVRHGSRAGELHLLTDGSGSPREPAYPDVLVCEYGTSRVKVVIDAKYKLRMLERGDLYQILAYQSALAAPEAWLVYPAALTDGADGIGPFGRFEDPGRVVRALKLGLTGV